MKYDIKTGIIMDFDDTLVETTVIYEESRKMFAEIMTGQGFPLEEILDKLDRTDIANVKKYGGFMKRCFPEAMEATYDYFCRLGGMEPDEAVRFKIKSTGWWVFDQEPVPVPGSHEVLEELARSHILILATKGDPDIQWKRIKQSGLEKFFRAAYVLTDKDAFAYGMIARENSLEPSRSWVVGNSLKSDINPALAAGFNCIHIPNPYTWSYENEEPAGEYVQLGSLQSLRSFFAGAEFSAASSFYAGDM